MDGAIAGGTPIERRTSHPIESAEVARGVSPHALPVRLPVSERGLSLMEAIAGTVIAVIAVLGLAHSFGMGRALVNRYEVARVAMGVAQGRMEQLGLQPPTAPDLAIGTHPGTPLPFTFNGATVGGEFWRVAWVDDPNITGTSDLRRVTVVVNWTVGGQPDSISLDRLFPR